MKTLTTPELSAETYREVALEFESLAGYARADASGDVMAKILHEMTHAEHRRRGAILHRFAKSSHAAESDYQ